MIENHVNVIRPLDGGEQVSTAVLLSLLNSEFVDQLFRCINGSVAVSAYELEALPLPDPWQLTRLDHLVVSGADTTVVEREVKRLYRECS